VGVSAWSAVSVNERALGVVTEDIVEFVVAEESLPAPTAPGTIHEVSLAKKSAGEW
jgi:hypothetical protein